jgi:hypothetical protein
MYNYLKIEDMMERIIFLGCSHGELWIEPRFIIFGSVGE